jgi:hypothetical protein
VNGDEVVLRIFVPGARRYIAQVIKLDHEHPVYGTFVWRAAVEIEHVPKKPWRVVGGPDGAPRRERLPPVVVGQVPPSRWLDDENALHGPWPDYRKIVEVERSLTDPWAGWAWAPGQGNVQVPMDGVHGALARGQRKLVHRPAPTGR